MLNYMIQEYRSLHIPSQQYVLISSTGALQLSRHFDVTFQLILSTNRVIDFMIVFFLSSSVHTNYLRYQYIADFYAFIAKVQNCTECIYMKDI